jgi:hypothetical protein
MSTKKNSKLIIGPSARFPAADVCPLEAEYQGIRPLEAGGVATFTFVELHGVLLEQVDFAGNLEETVATIHNQCVSGYSVLLM